MRYLLGNWKMNMSISEIENFIADCSNTNPDIYLGVAVPSIYYAYCYKLKQKMAIGAQNVCEYAKGAFTGEISASMLNDVQADFCLVGHSERRQYFGETDSSVNQKIKQLQSQGILPILCIGETLAQYENNETKDILRVQLECALQGVDLTQNIVVAYEPVWAIGTGKTAEPGAIDEICGYIKSVASELGASNTCVLYGGSVNSKNSESIVNLENVDGALVGGASQNAVEFMNILKSFN